MNKMKAEIYLLTITFVLGLVVLSILIHGWLKVFDIIR